MKKTILRNFLEIYSLSDLKKVENPSINLNLVETKDFQLNKFLYKQIGKKHNWLDRLNWSDQNWIQYVSQKNLYTYILKDNEDLVGYFELNLNEEKKEAEIVYLGILQEYYGKKIGAFLLSEAIQKSFSLNSQRVWVHTCSLDHKNALNNYLSRGMKIFKTETISI